MKKIVLIVGASGVGKDSLLKKIKTKIDANFVKRYITRIPDKNESNYYVDYEAFEILKNSNYFVSTWNAHKNHYAIVKDQIKDGLNIISISRSVIKDFEKAFHHVTTINITVSKEILRQRLEKRGRESKEEIENRLNRSYSKIEAKNLIKFDNSNDLETSSKKLIEILKAI